MLSLEAGYAIFYFWFLIQFFTAFQGIYHYIFPRTLKNDFLLKFLFEEKSDFGFCKQTINCKD